MTEIIEGVDLHQPFNGKPYYHFETEDGYGHREYVDPFPCYAHDLELVRQTMERVYKRAGDFRLAPHSIYVLHAETETRTNGWAADGPMRRDKDGNTIKERGYVVLAGKRIPPHPAMTRYLVAHEIGHHADWDICYRRGLGEDGIDDEYAALRGLTHDYKRYDGGAWHSNVGEMIANDFRIIVCGIEREFWPHPGFDHPDTVKGLWDWWEKNWWEPLTSGT